ncbi:VIT1/CCC1 transporter family protein [Streptomyces sp. NP160]|uniref:VIT1/CCC1 transporter family protein n=1 Tax=Streptomyces sp. NP160 TaxID=2586637 RepID=UPI001C581853|nr:VIT1/CCC1 transporter family protein [Streptomyces sp. NP160]
MPGTSAPTSSRDVRRWRRLLADEQYEATVYRRLAQRRGGEEREVLLALAEAEGRHAAHWAALIEQSTGAPPRPGRPSTGLRLLALLAQRFGSVFVLALAQQAEGRSSYGSEPHATAAMAADEQVHGEVVRGLAARGRARVSGTFRAAVFGANDGLVSNLALVLGVAGAGTSTRVVLLTGVSGLLAGALSMAAGEYVSVRSQRELIAASAPAPHSPQVVGALDVDANELALVYRARGMAEAEAEQHAAEQLAALRGGRTVQGRGAAARPLSPSPGLGVPQEDDDGDDVVGSAWAAAGSSFAFFASGALVPVLPFLVGLEEGAALVTALVLVSLALLTTGAVVGVLSGGPLLPRGLRQLAIGLGAAAVTYLLGLLFGTAVG